nr:serine/threonine-protein kinase [Gemmatales bacterium]
MSLATLNSEYFHQLLKESRLLDQAAIESIRDLDINLEPKQYAKLLIQRGLITSYQAEQLLRGKNKGFFIGSCKIQKIIGTGGMGKVYLAHHTSLQRQVAIKVLPAKAAQDRLTVERFFREGQVAAALNHPNIVSLFDFNELGGMYFLVMEYVDGINLQSFIDKGIKLEYRKVLPLMIQAAKGLHHAHMNGLVHRDIKPGNLMVNKQGVLKILDLGLAKETTQTHGVTEQFGDKNSTTGTVDYVSPEQALGNSTDHRSDIYSLGACCYALLTGAPPFSGTTAQKLMAHQMREPEEIRTLVPTVPPYLADTIKTMMAKKPAERFSSMQEVISAFEYSRQQASHVRSPDPVASAKPKASQIIAPSPVVEPPATTTIKQKKKSTKKFKKKSKQGNSSKWFIALGLFALLAIVIGITGFMLFRSGKNN